MRDRPLLRGRLGRREHRRQQVFHPAVRRVRSGDGVDDIIAFLTETGGLGAGAESRIPMGGAVIGGLLIGTLLTLFVIPAFYPWFSIDRAGDA